ncbi:hypothetical protein [Dictyobacter vulcani]|uniref:hypothetical protein n=1 Tax=Dictyobacter vulcani TaxID=2607529 RepID=UPI0013873DEF|nr:hypothetical protein [Dictyobacter vulcani]
MRRSRGARCSTSIACLWRLHRDGSRVVILFEKVRGGSTRSPTTLRCEQAQEIGSVAVEAPQHCGRFESVAPHKRSSAASACGALSTYEHVPPWG